MRFRGVAALEMIIVMIILLVVAGVIISLFLNVFGDITLPGPSPAQQFKDKVDRECNALCSDFRSGRNILAGIDYCKQKYRFDFNQDRDVKDAFQTNILLYACEDNFYCPHMHRCELQEGDILTLQRCKDLLCSELEDKYASVGDPNPSRRAEEEVLGLIKRGTCAMPEGEPDWFDAIYDPDGPICR